MKLIDSDVTSLYPSIILQNNLYPRHLGIAFINVYKKIYDQRVAAKREGREIENQTLKLALNGLTGNLQSIYSWVYDPIMAFKIRINGQLMLLMLIEAVTEAGFKLIQSNTDGIFVQVPSNREAEYMNICAK
jgi:DNA polymerase elongation subunit (family B)